MEVLKFYFLQVNALCSGTEFSCGVPECVDGNQECNFRTECSDGYDEKFCGKLDILRLNWVRMKMIVEQVFDCTRMTNFYHF